MKYYSFCYRYLLICFTLQVVTEGHRSHLDACSGTAEHRNTAVGDEAEDDQQPSRAEVSSQTSRLDLHPFMAVSFCGNVFTRVRVPEGGADALNLSA